MKRLLLVLFFISTYSFSQEAYYLTGSNVVDFNLNGIALKNALATKISNNTTFLPYSSSSFDTWDALKLTDVDPENSSLVLLIYGFSSSGTTARTRGINDNGGNAGDWNREHVFPRSLASPALTTNDPGPGTDIHNLRPSDVQLNSTRGNLKFADGSGNSGTVNGNTAWYPGDEWKGDVARMIMYMYLRYDGDGSSVAETQCLASDVGIGNAISNDSNMIDLFLQWNVDDPVSDVEKQRNAVSEERQGNRNPFIDNPYLATKIWGGDPAEDRWGTLSTNEISARLFNIYPIPAKDNKITILSGTEIINSVVLYTATGQQILKKENPQNRGSKIELNNLPSGFYVLRIHSENGMASKKVIIN